VRHLLALGGAAFVSGGGDGRVLWFDGPQAEPHSAVQLPIGITAMAMRPDGSGIVVADEQGHLRGTDRHGKWQFRRDWPGLRPTALAFGADASELWIGGTDHWLRCVDLTGVRPDRSWPSRNGSSRQLARTADGTMLVGGWWRTDRMLGDGTMSTPLALRSVSRFAHDPVRRRLVTTSPASGIGIIDASGKDRRLLPGGGAVALSTDGRRAAVFAADEVVVYDVDSGREHTRLPRRGASWLQIDRDGSHLLRIRKQPARVTLVEVATGTERWSSDGPVDVPFGDACAFAPNGDQLAVRVGTDRIRRLRTSDGKVLAEYREEGARLTRCAWSADGRWLATIQRSSAKVRRYEVATDTATDLEFALTQTGSQRTSLAAVALSADGSRIAVGTWHGSVFVHDFEPGGAGGTRAPITAHAGTIWSLQFPTADRELLVSAGGAQGIAVWDLASGECCYQALDDVAGLVQVSADGDTLACLLSDGPLLLDLGYHRRHVAGNLEFHLAQQTPGDPIAPGRVAELRAWAAATLARPWPRWR
jgi:hypothetical protein